uniref:Uncharacterized protein n=1 Tax=Panagrolaimus davidi TaxID=227884 RepID=A0A914QSC2_9BILA
MSFKEDWPSKFIQQSLELHLDDNENNYLKNTLITTTLVCSYFKPRQPGISNDDYLSRIILRLHRCDAKYIEIWKQKLSFNELKFLIGSGNVIDLRLQGTRIMDDQNEWIYLEKIMEFLPN